MPISPAMRAQASRGFIAALHRLVEDNQQLFRALLSARAVPDSGEVPSFQGLVPYYEEATRLQREAYAARGQVPDFDINAGIRLAFGMVAASVLLRDCLFPKGDVPRDTLLPLLDLMIGRSLGPV